MPAGVLRDRNRAARRAGVADDVGDRFAQGEGQRAILVGRQRRRDRGNLRGDARRDQDPLGVGDLVAQPAGAVAADRAPHFGQRVARDALDVADLLGRARRVAIGEPRRQLRLEHDDRQRVPEQIVQVAADALALGDPRHLHDRGLGHAQTPSFRRITANWMLVAPTAAPITSAGSQPQPGVPSHSACAVIETSISASQPNAWRGGAAKPRKATA